MSNRHPRRPFALLGTKSFGTFWWSSLLSNIGTWAQSVAQPWLLLSLGASPFVLGLDAFAMGGPVLMLTLVGGVLADRVDRRRVIAYLQSAQMLCPILIIGLLLGHQLQPWMIVLLSLVVGITDALSMPSFQSIVPTIVARDELANGIALNAVQFNLSRILGPAVAGLLMTRLGAAGAFGVSALSYVPFILVAIWVLPADLHPATRDSTPEFQRLRATLRDIAQQPRLRTVLLTTCVTSMFCSPLVTFCPLLVREVLHASVGIFSVAMVAFGVGGLLGATLLVGVDPRHDRGSISLVFALMLAVIVMIGALNTSIVMSIALFTLAGLAMTIANATANALVQSEASSAVRGQSVALFMLCARGGGAFGNLLTGYAIGRFGLQTILAVNGAIAITVLLRLWIAHRNAHIRPQTESVVSLVPRR